MVIKSRFLLLFIFITSTVTANPLSPISHTVLASLPQSMTANVAYPIKYRFTNNMNFNIGPVDVSLNSAASKYSGSFVVTANTCATSLPPGASCIWNAQFTPNSAFLNIISIKFSFAGNEYILPTHTSSAAAASCSRVGDSSTPVFDIEKLGDNLFAAGDAGVTYTNFSNPGTWQTVGTDINMTRVIQLEINDNTLFAAGIPGDNIGIKSHSATSLDSGAWSAFGSNTNQIYLGLLLNAGTFYATTFAGTVFSIAANADPASAWSQFGTDSIGSTYSGQPVVAAGNLIVPYVSVQYNSIGSPTLWATMQSAGAVVSNLVVFNNKLYAAGNGFGVRSHSSSDLTGSWDTVGTGLLTQRTKSIDILNDSTIIVGGDGTLDGRVYTNSVINPGEWTTVCQLGNNITIWEIKVIEGKAYLATSDGVYVLN